MQPILHLDLKLVINPYDLILNHYIIKRLFYKIWDLKGLSALYHVGYFKVFVCKLIIENSIIPVVNCDKLVSNKNNK